MVASLLLFLILQIFRGNLAWTPLLERYCWYSYYIPYLLTPLLLFLCALAAFRAEDEPLPRWSWVVIAGAAALILCAISNDLHQQMFRFPGGGTLPLAELGAALTESAICCGFCPRG